MPRDHIYAEIFYVLAALLAVGFVCNALIRPVAPKWHIKESSRQAAPASLSGAFKSYGIGRGSFDAKVVLAWATVAIPLAWGIWKTLENAAKIVQS